MKKSLFARKKTTPNIKLNVLVSPVSAQLDDIVVYIFEIIVLKGSNIKNLQLTDVFQSDSQEFIQGSITKDGVGLEPQINPSGGIIVFPEISKLITTTENVKISYGFKVKINKILNQNTSTEIQTNNAKVDWIDGETGISGEPIISSVGLIINKPKLIIEVGQKNITNSEEYTTEDIEFQGSDLLSYVISITNEGEGSSYVNVITDEISQYLIANNSSINVTKGNANITGNTFNWTIDSILPRENVKAILNMNVVNTLPSSCSISNLAKLSYKNSVDDTNIQGPINSNTINMNFNPISFKVVSTSMQIIENELEYDVILNIKKGITIFNATIYDILPIGQTYNNVATKQINNGIIENITPIISNETDGSQRISFPQPIIGSTNNIDTTTERLTVKYVFKVMVNNFKNPSLDSEIQTNKVYFNYFTSSDDITPKNIISSYNILILEFSYVKILVEQKNLTKGGVAAQYSTDSMDASINDIIHYKITVFSNKSLKAYSLNMVDVLSDNFNFIQTITAPTDGVITTPTTSNGGNLTWTIDTFNEDTNYIYEFEVQVNNNAGPGEIINNCINGTYYIDVNKVQQLNTMSNNLEINMQKIDVIITPDKLEVNLGDTIQYNVKVTVPKGSKLSELIIACKLCKPDNLIRSNSSSIEEYIKNSFKTDFAGGTFIQDKDGKGFRYQIKNSSSLLILQDSDLIINCIYSTLPILVQNRRYYLSNTIDFANVLWKNSFNDKNYKNTIYSCKVKIREPSIEQELLQRNVTKGEVEFTKELLKNVDVGDEIEYKYIITNNSNINFNKSSFRLYLYYIDGTSKILVDYPTIIVNSKETKVITGKDNFIKEVRVNGVTNLMSENRSYYIPWSIIFTGTVFISPSNFYKGIWFKIYQGKGDLDIDQLVMLNEDTIGQIGIIFPKGFIGENVQVENFISTNFDYIPYSLTSEGGVEFAPEEKLVFPNEGTIDATLKERELIYKFKFICKSKANVTIKISLTWQFKDNNNLLIKQNVNGNSVRRVSENTDFLIDLTVSKDGKNFLKNIDEIPLKQRFFLKVSIIPKITVYMLFLYQWLPAEIIIKDVISSSYDNIFIRNENLLCLIEYLSSGKVIDIIFSAYLTKIIPIKDMLNKFYLVFHGHVYQALIISPIFSSNNIQIQAKNIGFTTNVSNNEVQVGEEITYTVEVIIYGNLTIYNVVLKNILPNGQNYLGGATLNGSLIQVEQNGQNITFATQNTATEKLIYVFKAKVAGVSSSEILQEIQTNNATLSYSIESISGEKVPQSELASVEILVEIAKLQFIILQRNKSKETSFSVNKIDVELGDLIEYQIIIGNLGKGYASNINLEVILNETNMFKRVISNNTGSVNFDNTTYKVNWNVPKVYGEDTVILTFETQIGDGGIAGEIKKVPSSLNYDTGVKLKKINGQELQQQYPYIAINKTVENSYEIIGSSSKYNILVTIPKGIKCYNLNIQDILPIGQNFVSATLNNNVVIPVIEGKLIKFPSIPLIQAGEVDLVYNYELNSILESGNFITSRYDTQLNSSNITWSLDSNNTNSEGPISDVVQISIIMNKDLKIEKYQRRFSTGVGFTKENIDILKDEIVEYKIVVQNISSGILYNIEIKDILANNLTFQAIQSKTIGEVVEVGGVIKWNGITSLETNGGTATLIFTVIGNTLGENIPNKADGGFSLESTGPTYQKVYSNIVGTNIVSNISDTIKVEKYQRIASADGDFTKENLDVVKGEIIDYRIIITNISTIRTLYNINFNDILSNNLKYIEVKFVSMGRVIWNDTSGILGKVGGTIVWAEINKLKPKEAIELVIGCEVIK